MATMLDYLDEMSGKCLTCAYLGEDEECECGEEPDSCTNYCRSMIAKQRIMEFQRTARMFGYHGNPDDDKLERDYDG